MLDLLCARDDAFWFAEPVNAAEVPDYALVISTPMDYATIRRKLRPLLSSLSPGLGVVAGPRVVAEATPSFRVISEYIVPRAAWESV